MKELIKKHYQYENELKSVELEIVEKFDELHVMDCNKLNIMDVCKFEFGCDDDCNEETREGYYVKYMGHNDSDYTVYYKEVRSSECGKYIMIIKDSTWYLFRMENLVPDIEDCA